MCIARCPTLIALKRHITTHHLNDPAIKSRQSKIKPKPKPNTTTQRKRKQKQIVKTTKRKKSQAVVMKMETEKLDESIDVVSAVEDTEEETEVESQSIETEVERTTKGIKMEQNENHGIICLSSDNENVSPPANIRTLRDKVNPQISSHIDYLICSVCQDLRVSLFDLGHHILTDHANVHSSDGERCYGCKHWFMRGKQLALHMISCLK